MPAPNMKYVMYINKNYHPRELIEAKEALAKAFNDYQNDGENVSSSSIENRIIINLHKQGFRIIKTGNN